MYQFKDWMREQGIHMTSIEEQLIVRYYDDNGDGVIDRYEFIEGISPYLMEDQEIK